MIFYLWAWVLSASAGEALWVQTNLSFSSAQECQEAQAVIVERHPSGSYACGSQEPTEAPGTPL